MHVKLAGSGLNSSNIFLDSRRGATLCTGAAEFPDPTAGSGSTVTQWCEPGLSQLGAQGRFSVRILVTTLERQPCVSRRVARSARWCCYHHISRLSIFIFFVDFQSCFLNFVSPNYYFVRFSSFFIATLLPSSWTKFCLIK